MRWASTAVAGTDLDALIEEALVRLSAALGSGPEGPGGGTPAPEPTGADLVFAFLVAPPGESAARLSERLGGAFPAAHLLGCTAGGVIGGGREYEQVPSLSILAGRLPRAAIYGFHLEESSLPDPDAPPSAWHAAVGVSPADAPAFAVLCDPFSLRAERLLAGLDYAFPGSVTVGGLASGARRPGQQVLLHGGRLVTSGAVGVALMGDVDLLPAVAQGCRPLGPALRITRCRGHLLEALEGKPVLEVLREVLAQAPPRERDLARQALFLGFEMDPLDGGEAAWLVRNLAGLDPEGGGIYVGETLRTGRRVRFHVRDRDASAEDLLRTLETSRERTGPSPQAALLFSCMGRGTHLYGTADHDSRVFEQVYGPVPLGGFFCSGEIGPVGGTTHLHGYTSSFGLIRPRTAAAS